MTEVIKEVFVVLCNMPSMAENGASLHSNCDWILQNRSKSHIRSFEINGFKDLKPLQLAKGSKHEYEIHTEDA